MGQNAFGQPVRRKEDHSLLTGRGRFIEDYSPDGLAHAWMVRSHATRCNTIRTARRYSFSTFFICWPQQISEWTILAPQGQAFS